MQGISYLSGLASHSKLSEGPQFHGYVRTKITKSLWVYLWLVTLRACDSFLHDI